MLYECFVSATLRATRYRDKILAIDAKVEEEDQSESLFYQTQKMFAMLKGSSVHTYYEPSDLWHAFKDWDGEPVNVREHEDAYVLSLIHI